MNESKLKQDAKKIANIITKTNIDYRGDLLMEVSVILNQRTQVFVSQLFQEIANSYGVIK